MGAGRSPKVWGQLRADGEYLIGFIDADGYLRVDQQTLLEQAPASVDAKLFDEALKLLAEFREQAKEQYVSPVNLAKVYAGLGENEQVFEQLERACEERSVKLPWFMLDPCLDTLRADPRFADLVKRIGLPQ